MKTLNEKVEANMEIIRKIKILIKEFDFADPDSQQYKDLLIRNLKLLRDSEYYFQFTSLEENYKNHEIEIDIVDKNDSTPIFGVVIDGDVDICDRDFKSIGEAMMAVREIIDDIEDQAEKDELEKVGE